RLTDAQSSLIINGIIVPAFQQGDFTRGITEGAEAMIQVLGGDPLKSAAMRPAMPMGTQEPGGLGILGFFLMLVAIFVIGGGRGGRGGGRRALLLGALLGGMGRGGGGGFGGGGFGGGGGGFGGGGASGGW
ncbi:TPM domain-containing protein, partial [Stutzerimonas nitrititolerans]